MLSALSSSADSGILCCTDSTLYHEKVLEIHSFLHEGCAFSTYIPRYQCHHVENTKPMPGCQTTVNWFKLQFQLDLKKKLASWKADINSCLWSLTQFRDAVSQRHSACATWKWHKSCLAVGHVWCRAAFSALELSLFACNKLWGAASLMVGFKVKDGWKFATVLSISIRGESVGAWCLS